MQDTQSVQSAIIADFIKEINLEKARLINERLKQFCDSQNIKFPLKADGNQKLTILHDESNCSDLYVLDYGTPNQKIIITFYPPEINHGAFCDLKLKMFIKYK